MQLVLVAVVTAIISCCSVQGKTGHAVFAPKYAEPAQTYSVNVLVTREAADAGVTSVHVQASLNIVGVASQRASLSLSEHQLGASARFEFSIPASVGSSSGVKLSVSGTGDIAFEKQIDVAVQSVRGQIYVQMDKPMYRAGDKLRFIVFGLYNNFLPIVEHAMNITLQDAGGNLVQSWTNVRNVTSHGVVQCELLLSSRASLGTWRMNITFGEISGYYDFPVEDYKLSYFEASVSSNSTYFSRYDSNNAVEVVSEGRYQHSCNHASCLTSERGQVTGLVEMQVWLLGTGSTKYGSINITQNVGQGNQAKYVITSAALNRIVDISHIDRLLIYSKVIEAGSGIVNYANKTLSVIDRVYMLDYPKYVNPSVFHTDRDLYLHTMVLRADGKRLTSDEISKLQSEYAASCNIDDLENEEDFSLLPSYSLGRPASNGAVNATILTTDPELHCHEIGVKIKLKYRTGGLLLHSVKKTYARFASQANIKVVWENGKYDKGNHRPGDYISFVLESTSQVPAFHWMIVSRGVVFESGFVSRPNLQKQTFTVRARAEYMPRASIIVWTTLNDELVADALEFLVVDNTVSVEYSTGSSPANDNFGSNAVTQVRSPVALRFQTLPSSFVQWLAIDEKILIHLQSKISASAVDESELQGNNDFTPHTSQSLKENFLDVSRQLSEHLDLLAGVHKDSAPNTYEVFKQSEIILDTSYAGTVGMPTKRSRAAASSYSSDSNAVRLLFPEVFLFENEITPSGGSFIKRYTTPDTMTSWFAAALSLHPTRGVQVSNVVQIPVYHDFYLSIYIPTLTYKCNETVNATVYVHNTRSVDVNATLTANGAANYKVEGKDVNVSVSKEVYVPAKSVVITTFLMQFVVVGRPKVVVSAVTTDGRTDALETYVDVKPEGVPVRTDTEPVYCWSTSECSSNVVLEPKKECCTQAALGEVYAVITPVLMLPEEAGGENSTSNLPNPGGCCEQIMPGFTDLSYLLRTLRRDNKTTAQVDAEASRRLQVLLQQYLSSCARPDGSVTSWGNGYGQLGSTVLTSFVARTLVVAGELVRNSGALEQAKRSINWLLAHQQADGHLPPYPPNGALSAPFAWYTHLETGAYSKSIATAYALIGILEHETVGVQYASSHRSQLLRASEYLKKTYTSTNDIHYLSITAYALQLAGLRVGDAEAASVATAILNKLKPLAYTSNGKTFWPYNRVPESHNSVLTGAIPAYAIEVELASFVFELYYLNKATSEATNIFRFLLSQRDSQHKLPRLGYSSHSTALGQQAIGDYLLLASIAVSYSGTIKLEAVGGSTAYSATITVHENSITPIEVELPQGIEEVKVTSTAGLTQVYFKTLKYYQNPYHAYTSYHSGVLDLHVFSSPTSDRRDFATISLCNSWRRNETSGMVVSLVELPSGYALHSSLSDIQLQHPTDNSSSLVGSVEKFNDKNFAIYYNYLRGFEPVCTEVLLRRSVKVDNLATAAVRTYNYYEKQYIAFELFKIAQEPHLPNKHQHGEL